jgi:hypothetical protein
MQSVDPERAHTLSDDLMILDPAVLIRMRTTRYGLEIIELGSPNSSPMEVATATLSLQETLGNGFIVAFFVQIQGKGYAS